VLECLFGSNASLTRGQIGNLLDLVPDDVAEAVNSLLRTSLVTRELNGTGESYALSSSVRELLLRTPRDARAREDVYSRLREQQRIIAVLERTGTKDPLNESFVPASAPNHVRALVARVKPSVHGRSSRADQLRDLADVRRALEFDLNDPILHRTEALLLEQLRDSYGAIESFGKAAACAQPDACSQLRLAELLRDEQRLEEAIGHTEPLISGRFLENNEVTQRNKVRLFRAHWVSIL
jgi:tetratricopeptide (TPR) repeat protein